MRNRKYIILFLIPIAFFCLAASLVFADTSTAIAYLQQHPQDAWTTQALVAAGADTGDTAYLQSFSGTTATEYAKHILAIVALGENPYNFFGRDLVSGLLGMADGTQLGSADLLNDDFWGVLALRATGYTIDAQAIQQSKNFILAHQNTDGGWGYAVGGESDTNDTAAAITALVEAGMSVDDPVVQNALAYVQGTQNTDGGFPYTPGGESDGGSDAWVLWMLHKTGITAGAWSAANGATVRDHLASLQTDDGGFRWMASDGTASVNITAHAVIALSGKSFPVAHAAAQENPTFAVRIEGSDKTVCTVRVSGPSALDVVRHAASACDFTYTIENTSFGPYLKQINNDAAEGLNGWMYWVNWQSPVVGAADYALQTDDEVLWAYGAWNAQLLRISVDKNRVQIGESVKVLVESRTEGIWQPVVGVTVKCGESATAATDVAGIASCSYTTTAVAHIVAENSGYVRSNTLEVAVGGIAQSIDLSVEIEENPDGQVGTVPDLAFTVSAGTVNFGILKAGGVGEVPVTLTNTGTRDLYLESIVEGDALFTQSLKLGGYDWQSYATELSQSKHTVLDLTLPVSSNYTAIGIKKGSLIFWGTGVATNSN